MKKTELKPTRLDGRRDELAPGLSRRSFFMAAGAAGVGASALLSSRAEAQSTDWMQPGNNNHVLELQEKTSFESGEVGLDYYGHCAFKITSPAGATLVIDPWRDDPSGAWGLWFKMKFPETLADITMSTHTHFDHDAIDRPASTMVLDRMVGQFEFADLKIHGFADKHACLAPGWYNWTNAIAEFGAKACPPDNVGHMDMVTYVIETGGIRTLIWGDNRPNPPEAFWDAVGKVDVLTLPVDGSQHILSYEQGNAIVERLKPKIVIPTHYLNETTTYTLSTLQTADEWVKSQKSYKMLDSSGLKLAASDVSGMDREFMYFGANVETA
ncbi:MBL fold metallo-hydrolase [Afifella sp. IM 167]|uniref:MBL fold metallo-hydrolase n=1 Tax=Afifella sp. IM 167 TaxID=2033586 RepID=UPI001CCF0983|nr:MBL fold metallo-hydrolase [Afifella sp. IM 167]MBZ8133831.1 Zn-dependent hydrolase [Afifella sp. IM 167]